MSSVVLSSKGQLVIPAQERKALRVVAGSLQRITVEGGKLIMEPQDERRTYQRVSHRVSGLSCMEPVGEPAGGKLTAESVTRTLDEIGLT